jgi:hypothetical protein
MKKTEFRYDDVGIVQLLDDGHDLNFIFDRHIRKGRYKALLFRVYGEWAIMMHCRSMVTEHPDKAFIEAKNGTYILPKDGSYIRYISNSWYE